MNEERLGERVVARLTREAEIDPMRWVPAIWGVGDDGAPYGLAVELLANTPTDGQLRVLARVMFRLGISGIVEVARFRQPPRGGAHLGAPVGPTERVYGLAAGRSKPLQTGMPWEYAVRLASRT